SSDQAPGRSTGSGTRGQETHAGSRSSKNASKKTRNINDIKVGCGRELCSWQIKVKRSSRNRCSWSTWLPHDGGKYSLHCQAAAASGSRTLIFAAISPDRV